MSKQTAASFFMFSLSEATSAALYQALRGGVSSYQQLGERLVRLAEQAYAFRQFGKVREMGLGLVTIPIGRYQAIGQYFLAVAANSRGNGDHDEAKRLFELVIDTAPDEYKVRSVLSLGALSFNKGDFNSALYYLRETLKTGRLTLAGIQAVRGMSVIESIDGNHQQALKNLESIVPVMKYAPAHIYFDLLNSYAVELGAVGRKDEARNVIRHVLASPFISAYPEWRETAEELRPPRRSLVTLGSGYYNVVTLPERESNPHPTVQPRPARVLSLTKWKKQMAKKDKDKDEAEKRLKEEIENMSAQDMGFKLLDLIAQHRPGYDQMRAILEFVLALFFGPQQPGPDKPAS